MFIRIRLLEYYNLESLFRSKIKSGSSEKLCFARQRIFRVAFNQE